MTTLRSLVETGGVVVLSGAGLSTESGIPDYRGPTGATRTGEPMTYQRFVSDAAARQRYWARSHLGWRQIDRARPNDGHHAVAALQGVIDAVITQNVDGLHQAAGASNVIELHGGLDRVVCLGCGTRTPRVNLDARLRAANPDFAAVIESVNADGDVELDDDITTGFIVVGCALCGGVLKPDVIFFGENVPRERVMRCYDLVDAARSLLVLGSSLTVFSGLRFVRRAATNGIPVAIVNDGPTRGDELATVREHGRLGEVLSSLAGFQAVRREVGSAAS